jgi:hypothetical protein
VNLCLLIINLKKKFIYKQQKAIVYECMNVGKNSHRENFNEQEFEIHMYCRYFPSHI